MFFRELSAVIFVTDLIEGVNRLISSTYEKEKNDKEIQDDIEYFSNGLSRIESEHNPGIHRPFKWGENITAERFQAVFEDKAKFIAGAGLPFFSKIFIDSIALDKNAAIKYLLECGYSLQQEVKGISQALVERIKAMPVQPPGETPTEPPTTIKEEAVTEPFASPSPMPEEPPASSIIVPRDLWEGKTPKTLRAGMMEKGYDNAVIAHVLFYWCQLNNKKQIGKLLGDDPDQDDSTHLRRTNKLLKKAEALTITST
jgi:hypothetical protein